MNLYLTAVEKYRQKMLNALDYIWKNPETGYREWKTHAYLEKEFTKQAVENYKPLFENKEAYFAYLDSIALDKDAVTYHEDGSVTLL